MRLHGGREVDLQLGLACSAIRLTALLHDGVRALAARQIERHHEFRRRALDLIAAGRSIAQVALDLQLSQSVLYSWRRQELVDAGLVPGQSSEQAVELVPERAQHGSFVVSEEPREAVQPRWRILRGSPTP